MDFNTAPRTASGGGLSGPSAARPSLSAGLTTIFYDTDLGLPIFWNGSRWTKADGTLVADVNIPTDPTAPPGFQMLTSANGTFQLLGADGAPVYGNAL